MKTLSGTSELDIDHEQQVSLQSVNNNCYGSLLIQSSDTNQKFKHMVTPKHRFQTLQSAIKSKLLTRNA